jgi:hypothetical protein
MTSSGYITSARSSSERYLNHSVKIKERCVHSQLVMTSSGYIANARSSSERYLNYQVIHLSDSHLYVYCLQTIISFKKLSDNKDNLQYLVARYLDAKIIRVYSTT